MPPERGEAWICFCELFPDFLDSQSWVTVEFSQNIIHVLFRDISIVLFTCFHPPLYYLMQNSKQRSNSAHTVSGLNKLRTLNFLPEYYMHNGNILVHMSEHGFTCADVRPLTCKLEGEIHMNILVYIALFLLHLHVMVGTACKSRCLARR